MSAVINATKQAAEGSHIGVAFIEQLDLFPMFLLLAALAVLLFVLMLSITIVVLRTVRIAELEDITLLLQAINAVRSGLGLSLLSQESPLLRAPRSLLFPF